MGSEDLGAGYRPSERGTRRARGAPAARGYRLCVQGARHPHCVWLLKKARSSHGRGNDTGARGTLRLARVQATAGAVLRSLGPGLIAGASDNDPTTVATLAVIGSTTGFGLAWLVILIIPMLVVVQVISASIGSISREGLEDVIRVSTPVRFDPVIAKLA